MSQYSSSPDVNVNTAIATTPTDRVRWGPIVAGFFAALSTLVILSVLGVAVAGSTYDPGYSMRNFGIGAGIWGAVSLLIAFFVGGWLAARSAAVRGPGNGTLNGAMVWVVTIPLILYMVSVGVGGMMRAGVQGAASAGTSLATNPNAGDNAGRPEDRAQTAGAQMNRTAEDIGNRVQQQLTPENQKEAARNTAWGAWGTLISLLLGLAAAAFGGWTGAREYSFLRRGERGLPPTRVSSTNP